MRARRRKKLAGKWCESWAIVGRFDQSKLKGQDVFCIQRAWVKGAFNFELWASQPRERESVWVEAHEGGPCHLCDENSNKENSNKENSKQDVLFKVRFYFIRIPSITTGKSVECAH